MLKSMDIIDAAADGNEDGDGDENEALKTL